MSSINLDLDFQDFIPANSGADGIESEVPVKTASLSKVTSDISQVNRDARLTSSVIHNLPRIQSDQMSAGTASETLEPFVWLAGKGSSKHQRGGGWGLGLLAQYFNVTTDDVLQRIIWSALPIRKSAINSSELGNAETTAPLTDNQRLIIDDDTFSPVSSDQVDSSSRRLRHYSYIESFIQSRPDFYGPFWICTTLVFSIAVFSNIVNFMQHKSRLDQVTGNPFVDKLSNFSQAESIQSQSWHYRVEELNMATTVIMFYIAVIPTFIWFLFWFYGCAKYYTLSETICAYGYSLSLFIPLSALLMVQATIFRYFVIIMASQMSGLVLVLSFMPLVQSGPDKMASRSILIFILACHLGLAYILHRIMLV